MSLIHNQLQPAPASDSEWHVKIADGSIYGPVDLATLRSWSSQGRIEPDNAISQDREKWILAQDLRDLQMSWIAHLPDGTSYGPFNIHLLPELKQSEVLPPGTELEHRYSGERHPADDPTMDLPTPSQATINPSTDDGELPLLALMQESSTTPPPVASTPEPDALPATPTPADDVPDLPPPPAPEPIATPELMPEEATSPTPEPPPEEATTPTPEPPPAAIIDEPLTELPPAPAPSAPTEAILSGAVLAQRLEALQNSASLARSQLAATRKELSEQKAYASTLSDQTKKAEEELTAVTGLRTEAERGLVEATDRATLTESELDNSRAQLGQLQDHYDRLQDESQKQFESLDSARAELMRQEQLHKEDLTLYDDRITSKTALLARAVRMILQDDDLDIGQIPEGLLAEESDQGEKELLLAELERLRASGERDRRRITELSDKLSSNASAASPSILRFIGGVVGIALASGILILLGLHLGRKEAPQPPLTYPQVLVQGAPIPDLTQRPDATEAPPPGAPAAVAPADLDLMPASASRRSRPTTPASDWPEFTLPDAHILPDGNRLSVVYRFGLFDTETTLVEQAEEALARFAEQIRPYTKSFKVIAEGHTDATKISGNDGQYMDNYALGMARARAVRDVLVTKLGLPEEAVEPTSLGENSPLFPNNSDANRQLNRTVVLHVMPK